VDAALRDEPFCYLTTTGRVTGKPHRIEIWFAVDRTDPTDPAARDGSTIYLMAGGRERSDWVANLQRDPACRVEIGAAVFTGRARVVEGTDVERVARDLVYEKYRRDDDLESWRESALPVAIELTRE
jgi:deazaflavin-dependent oxidoreductase (nitroreductase family)